MFCPRCEAEYRPGFSRCSDCGVDLVDSLEQKPARSRPSVDDAPVVLCCFTTTFEAASRIFRRSTSYGDRCFEIHRTIMCSRSPLRQDAR